MCAYVCVYVAMTLGVGIGLREYGRGKKRAGERREKEGARAAAGAKLERAENSN